MSDDVDLELLSKVDGLFEVSCTRRGCYWVTERPLTFLAGLVAWRDHPCPVNAATIGTVTVSVHDAGSGLLEVRLPDGYEATEGWYFTNWPSRAELAELLAERDEAVRKAAGR